jgi:structural maintenance of chromosome 3 (chondroitin sulfate proteoglycan 6)
MSEVQKLEQRLRQAEDGFEPLKHELRSKSAHLDNERNHLDAAIKRRDTIEKNMSSFLEEMSAHETEIGTDFKKSLTSSEERQLEELSSQTQQLQKRWNETSNARRELERRKQLLEGDLRQNLQMKLDQLNSQAFEHLASGSSSGNLKEVQRELNKAQKALKAADASLNDTQSQMEQLTDRLETMETEKASREQALGELTVRIDKQQKRVEKTLQRKALLTAQAAECAKNIRDLGVLPEEAFDKYENMEAKTVSNWNDMTTKCLANWCQITSKLKRVNEALKKYKHVNKKAFEQYSNFTTQQEHLLKRRKELDASQASIEELVEHLDRRKDEAIERTFKQVSKEFATIFQKLVPAGHGRLVIQRRTDRRQEPDPESGDEGRGTVENYLGVGISVSFNSKHLDEQQKIQQLSGGQKSESATPHKPHPLTYQTRD